MFKICPRTPTEGYVQTARARAPGPKSGNGLPF